MHLDAAPVGFGPDQVELMAGTVDEHGPVPGVIAIAGFGLVEDCRENMFRWLDHRARQPLRPCPWARSHRPGAGAAFGRGDGVVRGPGGRIGVEEAGQPGQPLAVRLLPRSESCAHRPRLVQVRFQRRGPKSLGPHRNALAVYLDDERGGGGRRQGDPALVETVDVTGRGDGELFSTEAGEKAGTSSGERWFFTGAMGAVAQKTPYTPEDPEDDLLDPLGPYSAHVYPEQPLGGDIAGTVSDNGVTVHLPCAKGRLGGQPVGTLWAWAGLEGSDSPFTEQGQLSDHDRDVLADTAVITANRLADRAGCADRLPDAPDDVPALTEGPTPAAEAGGTCAWYRSSGLAQRGKYADGASFTRSAPSCRSRTVSWWRRARISASLPWSLIGNIRSAANRLVRVRYVRRSSTSAHPAAHRPGS
ncbi:hypothetical protein ACIREE_39435 [Streptomyces sp. NPDC102467]|uniref:hypothetical protein n=1 Tax=Streptomyces sp. NPDC102467 TaxID=3366179 RepID=UPI00381C7123